jgi:hypothetical protein
MLDGQFCWLTIKRSAKDKAIGILSDAISDWMPRWIMLLSMGIWRCWGKFFCDARCSMVDSPILSMAD